MSLQSVLPTLLLLLGFGFLIANLRALVTFVRFRRLRSSALLTWPGRTPPFYGLILGLGVVLGVLLFVKLGIQRRPLVDVFGVAMMFVYFGYMVPLSLRIGRGFYRDGIWAETGFVPYSHINGLTWREDEDITLVVIDRVRRLAQRLVVPRHHYGAARRLLRDKIAAYDIQFVDKGLDLGSHDEREHV